MHIDGQVSPNDPHTFFINDIGKPVGNLNLHNKDLVSRVIEGPIQLSICELMSISTGYATRREMVRDRGYEGEPVGGFEEVPHVDSPHEGDCRFEFSNVLWVSWVDGVAYRNGVGRVQKNKKTYGHCSLWNGLMSH
jgi:hypothetical protein